VIDPVKELFQIHIHHPSPALRHVLTRRTHRLVSAPTLPEAVARLRKVTIEYGFRV
jgi:hypothetical protein